jgi:hypothetical protein
MYVGGIPALILTLKTRVVSGYNDRPVLTRLLQYKQRDRAGDAVT